MAVTSPFNAPAGDRRNGGPIPGMTSAASGASVPGDRLPRPPRRRRPGFAALAVLLVVGSAAAAGLLAMRMDERTPVLVAKNHLPVGERIQREDLAEARVSADGLRLIPSSQVDAVVGQYVTQEIPAGRLLDGDMIGGSGLLKEGYVAIGVPLKSGSLPASGLHGGDRVKVIRAVDGEGTLLTDDAVVGHVEGSESESSRFGGGGGGSTSEVTIVVRDTKGTGGRQSTAVQIGAAAAAGQIVLELRERGTAGDG